MWDLNLVAAPANDAEPLDLDTEVIPHLRLGADESAKQAIQLAGMIGAARSACETFTGRQLITATWELWLQDWWAHDLCRNGAIRLPKPLLQQRDGGESQGSRTKGLISIKYLDAVGAEQTLSESLYQVLSPAGPKGSAGLVFPAYGATWPTVRCQPGAVKIRYTAGYGGTYTAVPKELRQGMLLRVAELYERRDEATVGTIQSENSQTGDSQWWGYRTF